LKKLLAILGSTGSIGTQTLEVVREHPGRFGIEVLTAWNNCDLLVQQAREFLPNAVVIGNEACYPGVRDRLKDLPIKVYTGESSLAQIVDMESVDMVLNAMVGYAGLNPTLRTISAGKDLALANKESLVVAGNLVMSEARRKKVRILPVDSEHSAIFQCLSGELPGSVEKIILTASGGPFRGKQKSHLRHVTRDEALQHPNWKMGNKITIDSASMMNKGLEVIEARWLFDIEPSRIEVIIHPQSIIHSMVQFRDGSIKAQMGVPDMKLPILYALSCPERIHSSFERFSFARYPQLTFEAPDREVFRTLSLAYQALEAGGNQPCVLNAANEMAVEAFLEQRIGFLDIPEVIEHCLHDIPFSTPTQYDDYVHFHHETRKIAATFIKQIG